RTQERRGGRSDGATCRLPNGSRTAPVTREVVADSRDQPPIRAHGTKAGTVTTPHGLPATIAENARAGPVPSVCEVAQPPRPLTLACSRLPTASAPLPLPAAAEAQRSAAQLHFCRILAAFADNLEGI